MRLFWSKKRDEFSLFCKEMSAFIRHKLCEKKIVIISENRIISVPVSFRVQACFSVLLVVFMLWVSYSTSKYFAYDSIISKKNMQIWETNNENEDLQYRVANLHDNLIELNQYFDNIRKYDQISSKKIFSQNEQELYAAGSATDGADTYESYGEVQGILSNIRDKVLERIDSLETIIEMTGLKVEEVADNNDELKRVLIEGSSGDVSHQGGAYDPLEVVELFQDGSFGREIKYLKQLENVIHSFPLVPPMRSYWVSSNYGRRIDPMKRRVAMHHGMDLVGRTRSKVYSSAPGVVKFSGLHGAYGRFIEIDHGSGVTTRYGHLNKSFVKKGSVVNRGQLIGLQGNTGRSTGMHLHYEVRYNGKSYDPKKFLYAGKYVF